MAIICAPGGPFGRHFPLLVVGLKKLLNKKEEMMRIKTNLKAGGRRINHNETLVRVVRKSKGLKVRTSVKAGGKRINHNQILVHDSGR